MSPDRVLLASLLLVGGCVNRPRAEASPKSMQVGEPEGGKPSPRWRDLADRRLNFERPAPLVDVGPPPTELPPTSKNSSSSMFDDSPGGGWEYWDHRSSERSAFCAHINFGLDGQRVFETRIEQSDERESVEISMGPFDRWESQRCWRDSQGRIMRYERQWSDRSAGLCDGWSVSTTKESYDEHGEIVFSETTVQGFGLPDWDTYVGEDWGGIENGGHPDDVYDVEAADYVEAVEVADYVEVYENLHLNVFQNIYEGGRLVRYAAYKVSPGFSEASMERTCKYEWADERLARHDCFDSRGEWNQSKLYTWAGDLLRIDTFKPVTEDPREGSFGWLFPPGEELTPDCRTEIYRRRGSGDYVPLYASPNTQWEYSTEDDIETVTKYVGEQIVERRRSALVDGERRPLTVEQLKPERNELATVEQWDWSNPTRVLIERPDGRDVYMLDCSALPPIDDLVDPDCPPPMPIR